MAEVYEDGVAFGDDLVSVDEVGQGEGGVLGTQFSLVLLEPLGPSLCAIVAFLGVGKTEVLHELADAFTKTAYGPVA